MPHKSIRIILFGVLSMRRVAGQLIPEVVGYVLERVISDSAFI